MIRHTVSALGIAAAVSLVPSLASAHPGHGVAAGFVGGFAHPVGGLDHLLAMGLVGMLAFQLGGRALLALPASFLILMGAGAVLGMAGIGIPFVEAGIALSIVAFGLALAIRADAPLLAACALTALFAVFHGHAHGTEMPPDASGFAQSAGFLFASTLLHAAGIGIARVLSDLNTTPGAWMLRAAGGAAAVCGVAILAGAL